MIRRPLILISALVGLCGGAPAGELRDDANVVVELFTSQGCSSCPPADELLAELDGHDEVIALAYHVDYWDYIGWTDTFGSEAHSDFQRAYAQSFGDDRIYTPQLVVNGQSHVVGSRRAEVEREVGAAKLPVGVDLVYETNMLHVEIAPAPDQAESVIWLVTFKGNASVEIERGENRGRHIGYSQIVTGRQAIGMWDPHEGASMKLPLRDVLGEDSDGAAILVQEENEGLPGPILAAASLEM